MSEEIKEIVGLTPVSIVVSADNDEIAMTFTNGAKARWYHEQDCCEDVTIYDVVGDWSDLVGNPILVAEERVSDDGPETSGESDTWTFYSFRGIKGSVDVRWWGASNGYYSESVDFRFTPPGSNADE